MVFRYSNPRQGQWSEAVRRFVSVGQTRSLFNIPPMIHESPPTTSYTATANNSVYNSLSNSLNRTRALGGLSSAWKLHSAIQGLRKDHRHIRVYMRRRNTGLSLLQSYGTVERVIVPRRWMRVAPSRVLMIVVNENLQYSCSPYCTVPESTLSSSWGTRSTAFSAYSLTHATSWVVPLLLQERDFNFWAAVENARDMTVPGRWR